jgi:hypothetical protein
VCATDIDAYLKRNALVPLRISTSSYVWNDSLERYAAQRPMWLASHGGGLGAGSRDFRDRGTPQRGLEPSPRIIVQRGVLVFGMGNPTSERPQPSQALDLTA